jgi:hypothetical protein
MLRKTISLIILFSAVLPTAAQTTLQDEKKQLLNEQKNAQTVKNNKPEIPAEIIEKAIAVLKTSGHDAEKLNLPENRIRYLVEIGDLLWTFDEKTAREFFVSAVGDLRFIMQSLDAFLVRRENGEADDDSFFGGDRGHSRFYAAQSVRQNMLLNIVKHDPQMAFDILRETTRENYKEFGWNDASFETRLAVVIARNDANRALEIGLQRLAKNSFEGINDLINNLHRKDAEKGAKLAAETVRKLKTTNLLQNQAAYNVVISLFNKATAVAQASEKNEKNLLLSEGEVREVAEMYAKVILETSRSNPYYSYPDSSQIEQLKKYAPLATAQVERQINVQKAQAAKANGNLPMPDPSPSPAIPNSTETRAAMKGEADQMAQAEAMSQIMQATTTNDEKKSTDKLKQDLSKIKNRSQRMLAMSQLARVFAERGDKDAAGNLLIEVNSLQVSQPRRAIEMLQNLLVANANSQIEPERAFTALESTIYEFNGIADSLARIGEFAGIKEFMDNNEFALGGFASEFFRRGSTQEIGVQPVIVDLAKADFDRTIGLANKFERAEIRLEASMLIVRSILPQDKNDEANLPAD